MSPVRRDPVANSAHPVDCRFVNAVPAGAVPLGEIHFGASPVPSEHVVHPQAWVGMPVLTGEPSVELWTSPQPVLTQRIGPLTFARNRDVLFGCFVAETVTDFAVFEARVQEAYARLLTLAEAEGYPHLLRIWNYFPGIGDQSGGLDRYMVFCRGRHQAIEAHYGGRFTGRLPAASAVGTRHGGLVIYFLAGRTPGRHRENPRQVSAYCYPPQYGPKSPSFARGTLVRDSQRDVLYLSGTASIVGHESRHPEDPLAQLEETLANLEALIDSTATEEGMAGDGLKAITQLKVYVRRRQDLAILRPALESRLGPATQCLYLQADICRPELLLEIEAIASLSRA
jgi:chorismate lyase/3-hydroxybenzoate synthase